MCHLSLRVGSLIILRKGGGIAFRVRSVGLIFFILRICMQKNFLWIFLSTVKIYLLLQLFNLFLVLVMIIKRSTLFDSIISGLLFNILAFLKIRLFRDYFGRLILFSWLRHERLLTKFKRDKRFLDFLYVIYIFYNDMFI